MAKKHVINIEGSYNFPRGFTISDNRIEDELQRFLTPAEYVIWRQYLRFWGSDKKKAYPSLSYLSTVTGLSEKTIRKCNKELKKKKFINFYSGTSGRANIYHYKPIEEIIEHHYGKMKEDDTPETPRSVAEVNGTRSNRVNQILNKLDERMRAFAEIFISLFETEYNEKFGFPYELDVRDVNSIIQNIKLIESGKLDKLVKVFFASRNQFLDKSDRSIYILFKSLKTLISEYNSSDIGRWEAQAEKIWNDVSERLQNEKPDIINLKDWLGNRLSGANKTRDEYILDVLSKKYRDYLVR